MNISDDPGKTILKMKRPRFKHTLIVSPMFLT